MIFTFDRVKKLLIIAFFSFPLVNPGVLPAQSDSVVYAACYKFHELYSAGDYAGAVNCLLPLTHPGYEIPVRYRYYVYNGLGGIDILLGKYYEALDFLDLAEKYASSKYDSGSVYVNKGLIYKNLGSYDLATEFHERGIRYLLASGDTTDDKKNAVSKAYMNFGITYLEKKNYRKALDNFLMSRKWPEGSTPVDIALTELNLAKAWSGLSVNVEAFRSFEESSRLMIKSRGPYYCRLAEVYFAYGEFLTSVKKYDEALDLLQKARSICIRSYGEKNNMTSKSHKLLGDFYLNRKEYLKALDHYQNSLISITEGFDDHDIFSNPPAGPSLYDLRFAGNLKAKSAALAMLASAETDSLLEMRDLNTALETAELAVEVITRIRNSYITGESRLFLAENEKDTYMSAVKIAERIFLITGDSRMTGRMYELAGGEKAAVLRNEIMGNDLLYTAAIPDSVLQKYKDLVLNADGCGKLVDEEYAKERPDTGRIASWKDEIFKMNREAEKISADIGNRFPRYGELLQRTSALPPGKIMKRLKKNETLIDYYICNPDTAGIRRLYAFIITRGKISFSRLDVDSLFNGYAQTIHSMNDDPAAQVARFREYTSALAYMYDVLIRPVEGDINGTNLIIIPDEEIAWLPFDAFLASAPAPGTDYENLDYLVRKYAITCGYSSSLLHGERTKRNTKVISFLPEYEGKDNDGFGRLTGAEGEIESIYRWFGGRKYTGEQAGEKNFLASAGRNAILHLAMHSVYDTLSPQYTCLQFDTRSDTSADGRLYSYEICLERINSPMVVLSACNSGAGKIYHGEGPMSIARGFTIAGASSVVRTAWEVNDASGAEIMKEFYRDLARGAKKGRAMQHARLKWLSNATPAYASPYYWAAYEVLGDNSPVAFNKSLLWLLLIPVVAVAGAGWYYFRRRRMRSASL